jgi:hypothetical protein
MGVPAHDERDFAFAKKYGLAIKPVIDVEGKAYSLDAWQPWYADYGHNVNSGRYDGLAYQDAVDAIAADLKAKNLGEDLRRRARTRCAVAGGAAGGPRSRRLGKSARQIEGLPRVRLPEVRQAGAPRDRHHGHVRGLVLVLHPLRLWWGSTSPSPTCSRKGWC